MVDRNRVNVVKRAKLLKTPTGIQKRMNRNKHDAKGIHWKHKRSTSYSVIRSDVIVKLC